MNNASIAHTRRSIRPFHDADEAEVVGVWHRSGLAAYTYLPTWQALTMERAQCVFHHIIRTQCAIWVGTLNEQIVAYLAMNGSYIDRLYVDPSEWRKGWGTRFISLAKQLSPHGLDSTRIKRTLLRVLSMNAMVSRRSNSASVRHPSPHQM